MTRSCNWSGALSGCVEIRLLTTSWLIGVVLVATAVGAGSDDKVSYTRDLLPVFRARCQGCHQPAKAAGEYTMTSFEALCRGGETEMPAIVPGKPDESYLIEQITPSGGNAEMPRDSKPLSADQIRLIRQWIAQGARNDAPRSSRPIYDANHPPTYTLPPVITSLDYSRDGKYIAVAGFHEALIHKADGSGLVARLVGLSERIESVRFSPDGTRLAVTGGLPGRMGEVQIWKLTPPAPGHPKFAARLLRSISVSFDTLYGASWSPDGKLVAFGCADNSVRAVAAATGKQVLFQGAHMDWVRDTVFSVDGKNLVSVSRDMSVKLTEVASERFIDNITSITPGALKGGVNGVARHPQRDEVVIGGADGVPKVYRLNRETPRRIGDDANLIRRLPAIPGRVFSVAVSADGRRIAAGSSLNGSGTVAVYGYEFDTSLPEDLKKIMSKTVSQRSAKERADLDAYRERDAKVVAQKTIAESGVFAVRFSPDGNEVAVAGSDGRLRFIATETGEVVRSFVVVPVVPSTTVTSSQTGMATSESPTPAADTVSAAGENNPGPKAASITALEITPRAIELDRPFAYAQLVITAIGDAHEHYDVTRHVRVQLSKPIAAVSATGMVRPLLDGAATLVVSFRGQQAKIPVRVAGKKQPFHPDFVTDVAPVIARLGCNAGTCHGAAKGKNGFKLSLRGYDPIIDVRAFTDDLASRRANVASPDDSLMLLKATAQVPHQGGQRTTPGSAYYQTIRDWIADGARLAAARPTVVAIEVLPPSPTLPMPKMRQQLRVIATFANGRRRDVTAEAFIETSNGEVATVQRPGLVTAVRRGEAAILARYQGAYGAATLTVMGDRSGFAWKAPPVSNQIDRFVAAKWQRLKIAPSPLCTDAEFIRRVYLDLTGLPPSLEQTQQFLADQRPSTTKRDALIDRLIGSPDYVEYWTNKWSDLLQVNRKFLGVAGAAELRSWIQRQVKDNTPYDRFVREILTATGSTHDDPAGAYFKVLREPGPAMENTMQLFLAVRFSCNKCHDHPFERWTQDQYYQTAAYFARIGRQPDPQSKGRKVAGSAVMTATPLYEIIADQDSGEIKHERTGKVTAPQLPFKCDYPEPATKSRRAEFAAWITAPDNPYFARSYVNRLWGYLTGVGLIEPLDDIRAGNPPSNPELLDYLTTEFINSGFDTRHVIRLICKSRTYQLSIATNRWNADDQTNYAHAVPRRLPAEVLFDAIYAVTGAESHFPGVPAGTRAAALPDAGVKLPSNFLGTLGRPARESSCECERGTGMQLGPVMALVSGPVVESALAAPKNQLAALVAATPDDHELVNALFLAVLSRPANTPETDAALEAFQQVAQDHQRLAAQLAKREQYWKDTQPTLDEQRRHDLQKAKDDLAEYQQKIQPQDAQREKHRQDGITKADADLKAYDSNLPKHIADWEKQHQSTAQWYLAVPLTLATSQGAELRAQADRSVLAKGKAGKGTYTITVQTRLRDITGFRLETLPVPGLAGGGPGLPPNGNFVITEFQVAAAPLDASTKRQDIPLRNPKADFTQDGFNVAQAIDGVTGDQRGWAVHPAGGTVHWATFEAKKPVGFAGGTRLTFTIHQNHNAKDHRLARFRIALTTSKPPVELGLPESLLAINNTPTKMRTDEQRATLAAYFKTIDNRFRSLQTALAEAKKPLPIDAGVKQRESRIAELTKPVLLDAELAQLRAEVKLSERQLAQHRLTAAQDLAWALINSPAFLFNH